MTSHPCSERSARVLTAGLIVLLLAAGCGVPRASGPVDSFGLDLSVPPEAVKTVGSAKTAGAFVFIIDGLNARIFNEMLDRGQLPQIKKHLVDRGLYTPRAAANLPSITLVNLTSISTGVLPGNHGILGNDWFDRDGRLYRDYDTISQKNKLDDDYTAPTIFEHVEDRFTSSVFFQPHRGATKWFENWTSAGPPFYFGWYEFVDRLTLYRLGELAKLARSRKEWPAVTVVYMLAPDFRGYENGVESEEYRDAIRHTDTQIGRVMGDLQSAGLYDKLAFFLVSDHGLGEVTRHWSLETALNEAGISVAEKRLWENECDDCRRKYYDPFTAVVYGSGQRYRALCLQKPRRGDAGVTTTGDWSGRPNAADLESYPVNGKGVDLPVMLIRTEAVDAVAFATGPNRVRVLRKGGEVELSQPDGRGGEITYRRIRGEDPFDWKGKVPAALLAGQGASGRAWLEATVHTDFPDMVEPMLAYFRADRRGDIVLFAAPGWDFGKVDKAGHGGLRPLDMHVPLIAAGPGIPRGKISAARTVDIVPTILQLMGRDIPSALDGKSLLEAP